MKRFGLFRYIWHLSLVFILSLLSTAVTIGPEARDLATPEKIKHQKAAARGAIPRSGPVADLSEAEMLLAMYERGLPQAKSSRRQTLAELARLCFIMGEFGEKEGRRKYFESGRNYAENKPTAPRGIIGWP
jgi:hypothetical protein